MIPLTQIMNTIFAESAFNAFRSSKTLVTFAARQMKRKRLFCNGMHTHHQQ